MGETVEDLVDRGQGLQLDIRFDLACGGEGQRLSHVLARAHERAADRDAIGYHVEKRNGEFARRQTDQDARAQLAGHADALLKGDERGRGNQDAMSAAAGFLF